MKRCSLFCAGWWPLLVFPLLLLVPLLFFKWHAIEQDVASNADADLDAAGVKWATIETFNRGREVLITGTPPNQASIDLAKETAQSAYGVRSVSIGGDVKVPEAPPIDPSLTASVNGNSIVLRGELKDQASIDAVVAQANASFGSENVVNELSIGNNVADTPNISGFFAGLLEEAAGLATLTATIENQSLTLSGDVPTAETGSKIATNMRKLFSGKISNQLKVVAPPVKRDICQELVNELLREGKINFETGKSTIKGDSFSLLQSIANTAKRCPDANFEIAGHTDSTGQLQSNMRLSEARAQAVMNYLVKQGLSLESFSAKGYGPNDPIGDNNTAAGRAQNRRIEFRLKN